MSESAAYSRITAARSAKRFPTLLKRLVDGDITLTSITLLASQLTDDNCVALFDAARHASRRDVERLVASLHAQPDIPACVRLMPAESLSTKRVNLPDDRCNETTDTGSLPSTETKRMPESPRPMVAPRQAVAPLAADRYLLRVTIDAPTHANLERARDLLRHTIPNGDPALIVGRALTVLVDYLERHKTGRLAGPAPRQKERGRHSRRHVSAAVKRAVWSRDQGRCAFVGADGRCKETGFLEYHHRVPFAAGGATDEANLELRCRAHNAYEATLHFRDRVSPVARS